MSDMGQFDYVAMVEETPVQTHLIEYRRPDIDGAPGELVACALSDLLRDGLSRVYSCYHPGEEARSLGTKMILDHIAQAQSRAMPFVYLGYWVQGSDKMNYKSRFQPLEALTREGWELLEE